MPPPVVPQSAVVIEEDVQDEVTEDIMPELSKEAVVRVEIAEITSGDGINSGVPHKSGIR